VRHSTREIHSVDTPDLPEEEELTPDTVLGWEHWIAERLEETENGYRSKPDLLKHDANGEKLTGPHRVVRSDC